MSTEAKKKAAEAKARADDAFRRKDFTTAVDAYTQVNILAGCYRSIQLTYHHRLPPGQSPPLFDSLTTSGLGSILFY